VVAGAALVAGDPHPGNVLIEHGRVSAVLDFGDITAGDPATDLAIGWLGFDASGRAEFAQAYAAEHGPDDDTWQRARGWALCLGLALLANSDDNPALAAVGRHAIDQASAEP
jgi:aminoglycoside phosphotransferase (APT) family kinase protein